MDIQKNKAVFLDRDGTIIVDKGYLYKIEDFEFLPRALEALHMLQEKGFMLIIITNQSGIARGYYTEEDYSNINSYMLDKLRDENITITDVLFCPHLPGAKMEKYRKDCDCRKPKLGLFNEAIQKWNIDISQSYAIGDKLRDCSICEETECRGFLIGDSNEGSLKEFMPHKNICCISSLIEAAEIILKDEYNGK